jgi:hypothetical protein
MRALRLPARAALLAVIIGSLAAGGVIGAAADRFVLRHSTSYQYVILPAAGPLEPGQAVWVDASGRAAHANDNASEWRAVVGVVVPEAAPRGSVAVGISGVVEVRPEEDLSTVYGGLHPGDVVRGPTRSALGVALKVPATGPLTVLLNMCCS